jgi:hypothetical protein
MEINELRKSILEINDLRKTDPGNQQVTHGTAHGRQRITPVGRDSVEP